MRTAPTPSSAGWWIAAGLALAALGLARAPQGGGGGGEPPPQTQVLPLSAGAATADSNNRMIAVTGIDITGASILYLVDTVDYHLAVYQANGGTGATQGVKLVGARRIDLDLMLDGFNDKSDYPYKKLRETFQEQGLLPAEPAGGQRSSSRGD